MLSRRQVLALLSAGASPCFVLCDFRGKVLRQGGSCGLNPPGSTVKPLIAALLNPAVRFPCLRKLRISGHRLDCSHAPIPGALDLKTALAASCNSWFAQASRRLEPDAVYRLIQSEGGQASLAETTDELTLQVLGVQGLFFTPGALARAYVRLHSSPLSALLQGGGSPGPPQPPSPSPLILAGKTGTVLQGGWFAGWTDRAVIAVFIPGGTGAIDAAPSAREILEKWHAGLPA